MNYFKRLISIIMVYIIILQVVPVRSEAVDISAWGAIAIDADTGEVLFEKNSDKMLVPASMTKIMTTYIIFEEMAAGNLTKDSLIKVSDRVAKISRDKSYPMSVPLKSGGEYSVDQFIKLIMIPSASASCIAVAEHISGSEEKFVQRMNETAKKMGMQANFKNSHGARPHYTTPRSMAILVKTFIEDYPDILNYTSLQGINFNGKRYNILNKFINTMKYEGCDGFKTGTIPEARYCLASTAKRNDRRVIATVFGASSQDGRYYDSRKILDLAFDKVQSKDNSKNKTQLELLNLPENIRINLEYNPKIKFNDVLEKYNHNGKLYVDDELIKEVKNIQVENGLEINIPFTQQNTKKDSIEIKYIMEMPNNKNKEIVKNIKISSESPAIYKDVEDIFTEHKINLLMEKNLIKGLNNGYFGVEKSTNRADFITTLGRVVEEFELDNIEDKQSIYDDVKTNDYYNKYIVWAKEKNLIEGYKGKFMPKNPITIEETAKILDSFLKEYNIEIKRQVNNIDIDMEKLSYWAKEPIENLSKKDILFRKNIKNDPKLKLKRLQLIDILMDFIENIELEKQLDEISSLNKAN